MNRQSFLQEINLIKECKKGTKEIKTAQWISNT